MSFLERILEAPIIGAVNTSDTLEPLKESPCEVYFILGGELSELEAMVKGIKAMNKLVFIHVDLIQGLRSDPAGLRFVANLHPSGVITTKGAMVKEAKKLNLYAIQRLFLLDSKNLESGIQSVKKYQPDAVEILPGVLHKITGIIVKETKCPVITGGLILDKEDVIHSLQAGAIGVSTSKRTLWSI